jgi:hypothetical protein
MIFVIAMSANNASELPKHLYVDSLNFEKRINTIHSKVIDLTDIFALHHIKEFNEVYFEPLKFEDSVIRYLQKPVSLENKIIAICSMTKLPVNKYIDILNSYFLLYTKNKINEELLNRSIFNEFDTDNRLTKQYKNPQVRELLFKMINCNTLSKPFKADLKETLNGKRLNNLKRTGHL